MGTERSISYRKTKKAFQFNADYIGKHKDMTPKKSKLDPELKKRWVDALRSGKYKQGRGALKAKRLGQCEHCCLGVLCEVIAPEGFQTNVYGGIVGHSFNDGKSVQENYPNQNRMIDLGLYPSAYKKLAMMNDGEYKEKKRAARKQEYNFNDIADYIEKNL